jgi:hypothetical protein
MRKQLAILILALLPAAAAWPQDPRTGPVTPPPPRDIKRLPADAPAEPPPIPVEELIHRFTQKEGELARAHEQFNYRITVRVQETADDGTAGEWQIVSEIIFKPDGTRVGRVIDEPASTLKRTDFSLEDLQLLASLPPFILTPDQRDHYEFTYQGTQPVDELRTFVFRVRPRRLERRRAQFEGIVWVDDKDFAIVRSFGRMVTEVEDEPGKASLPFKHYETYREHVEGKYWFPTYTRSDEILKGEAGDTRLRLTIRNSNFRPRENSPQ